MSRQQEECATPAAPATGGVRKRAKSMLLDLIGRGYSDTTLRVATDYLKQEARLATTPPIPEQAPASAGSASAREEALRLLTELAEAIADGEGAPQIMAAQTLEQVAALAQPQDTAPEPAAAHRMERVAPWGYGWYQNGGKKMASGYLPTIDYPRSEDISEGPFPLYRAITPPDHVAQSEMRAAWQRVSMRSTMYPAVCTLNLRTRLAICGQ